MEFWKISRVVVLLLITAIPLLASAVTVYDIQYTDSASGESPLFGQIVEVSGIVTATGYYSSGNSNRFFISDPQGGAWRGVFCFNYDYEVEVGDEVTFTAEVDEYYEFTELKNLNNLEIISTGNPVPEPVEVSTADIASEEAYEGCLVKVSMVDVTSTPNNYGEWYVNDGSGPCQIDDSIYEYGSVSSADSFYYIIGAVDYSYDNYGINPRFAEDFIKMGDPIIESVSYDPVYPVTGQNITVQAVIRDFDGIIMNAEINWQISDEGWYTNSMQQLPEDTYSYTLTGLDNAEDFYSFTIWAEDDDGNEVLSEETIINVVSGDIILEDVYLEEYPGANEPIVVKANIIAPNAPDMQAWLIYTKKFNEKLYTEPMEIDSTGIYSGTIPGQAAGTTLNIGVMVEENPDSLEANTLYFYDELSYTVPLNDHGAVLVVPPHPFDPGQRDNDPDNDTIEIEYFAQRGDRVIMRIYNSEGKLMLTPENMVCTSNNGQNVYEWDGRDKNGELLNWGLYICHIEVLESDSGDLKTDTAPIVIGGPLK